MRHTNPPLNIANSRTLSRPPLQTIPTNPLQYTLSSKNIHNTQHSIHSLEHNTQTVTSNTSMQHHNNVQYHQAPLLEPIQISHLYHTFQQTLIIYKQTPHIQTII